MSAGVRRSMALLVLLAGVAVLLVPLAGELGALRVGHVRVTGEQAVRQELDAGGFFAVDVEKVRAAARALPWVREVTVRRVWPDSIDISMRERVAVASWNGDALLEDDASLFRPGEDVARYPLARLSGPAGTHAEVLARYKQLATTFGTLGGGVRAVALGERGEWQVTFSSGLTLVPDTPLDVEALGAFAAELPRILGARLDEAERIDLRHANGFAVRWRQPQPQGNEG